MRLGFSYVGLIYLVMLMVPNIKWANNKPKDYDLYVKNENKILLAFERVGEVLVSAIVLVFSDFNLRPWTLWCLWLVLSFSLMILYELYWIRYFKSNKTMQDQYSSFCGFPVAGATLPVLAFFLLGIYGVNIWLIIATIILGFGHIGIHLQHKKETEPSPNNTSITRRILRWAAAVLMILFFSIIIIPIGARNFEFIKHQENFFNGVDQQAYIDIGGQKQYILMTGKDVSNPVIIYLHGGPGGPDTMVMYPFADELMDDYTIVGWDQRGAGRTYYQNQSLDSENHTVSFDQALEDLDELVDYICKRFGQDKVIIMGHSYGSILGSQYVLAHPDKVSHFIAISQVVSMKDGERLSYQDGLNQAKAAGDDTDKMEKAYTLFEKNPSLENMLALRNTVSQYHQAGKQANTLWQGMSSPYFGMDDLKWFSKQMFSLDEYLDLNKPLFDYMMSFNAYEKEMEYQVPVTFISGAEDWTCPVELIEKYMDVISAPHKEMILIDDCGHSPQNASPKEFVSALKEALRHGESKYGE